MELCFKRPMQRQNGPVILATMYTGGTIATICLAMLYARHGEVVARTVLAVVQIVVTGGAIFSAWALQSRKRVDDAADNAAAAADAVLAVTQAIDDLAKYASQGAFDGKSTLSGRNAHADMVEEEVKALASLSLTALKPPIAASALVNYRRFARQWILVCRSMSGHPKGSRTAVLRVRLADVRLSEYELYEALGRQIPARLDNLTDGKELEAQLKKELEEAEAAEAAKAATAAAE